MELKCNRNNITEQVAGCRMTWPETCSVNLDSHECRRYFSSLWLDSIKIWKKKSVIKQVCRQSRIISACHKRKEINEFIVIWGIFLYQNPHFSSYSLTIKSIQIDLRVS